MLSMYVNWGFPKGRFCETLYGGAIWLNTELRVARDLCEYADACVTEYLGADPRNAHKRLRVEEFVDKVSGIKKLFSNSTKSKEYLRDFIVEIGQKPEDYFIDVPRLRVVPHFEYLHTGVCYALKPHRDLWYGATTCQINSWMTVYPIEPSQTMMINPAYFQEPVKNSSSTWDLKDWIQEHRPAASASIKTEERPHPVPLEEVTPDGEIRVAGARAEMLIFSAAHMHGTVPNYGDQIRFSVDFRIYRKDDLRPGVGAPNVDGAAKNVEFGYRDLFDAADFAPYAEVTE